MYVTRSDPINRLRHDRKGCPFVGPELTFESAIEQAHEELALPVAAHHRSLASWLCDCSRRTCLHRPFRSAPIPPNTDISRSASSGVPSRAPVESGSPSPRDKDRERPPENRERERATLQLTLMCRIWRSLPMTPYLPAVDRRRHHRIAGTAAASSSIAPIARPPSSLRTGFCQQQFRKKKCRHRPAAAALRSRPVRVDRCQSPLVSAAASSSLAHA
jgi:hypothetical protein